MAAHLSQVLNVIKHNPDEAGKSPAFMDVYRAVERAEIVIWSKEIYSLAESGCEAFEKYIPDFSDTSQLWCLDRADWHTQGEGAATFLWVQTLGQTIRFASFGWNIQSQPQIRFRDILAQGDQGKNDLPWIAARAFLDTSIVDLPTTTLTRSAVKHWAKRNTYLPLIKTVTLRRMEREARACLAESSDVNWSHRWHVRPHWAIRHCGANRSERKHVFIEGYIKGPEDKPIVLKDTIFRATR